MSQAINRLTVIREIMRKRRLRSYLEIGVFNGHIFFKIRRSFKVAVDPEFQFDTWRKIGKILINPSNLFNRYFPLTSDAFFAHEAARIFADRKVEMALIDGMHEYEFALRDIENTLRYLSPRGVIVVHDCNPRSQEAAGTLDEYRAAGSRSTWNGDVWKAILFLRSQRRDIRVFVLDADHGLGIICWGNPENNLDLSPAQIHRLDFRDLQAGRKEYLNLKPASYFYTYFGISPTA